MPKKPQKRVEKRGPLSEPMREFLTTGNYCLREKFPTEYRERFEIFKLAYPGARMREKLKVVWNEHKADIMEGWKGPGLPWAEELFEDRP